MSTKDKPKPAPKPKPENPGPIRIPRTPGGPRPGGR